MRMQHYTTFSHVHGYSPFDSWHIKHPNTDSGHARRKKAMRRETAPIRMTANESGDNGNNPTKYERETS